MTKIIPNTSKEIQTGLYQDIAVGRFATYSCLYSAEGYCFYDPNQQFYDDEGNLIPEEDILPEQRIYWQYCYTPIIDVDELNKCFISVPIQSGFEIA